MESVCQPSQSLKKTCNRRHSPVIYLFGGALHFIKNWLAVGRKRYNDQNRRSLGALSNLWEPRRICTEWARNDDAFIDALAQQGIAYVPFFPLGGFTPLQSSVLDRIAASLQVTPMQVALAWLLQRSPNVLLIPGTSSINHLRENLGAAALQLTSETISELNSIAKNAVAARQSAH